MYTFYQISFFFLILFPLQFKFILKKIPLFYSFAKNSFFYIKNCNSLSISLIPRNILSSYFEFFSKKFKPMPKVNEQKNNISVDIP